jgi:hypothetical protein
VTSSIRTTPILALSSCLLACATHVTAADLQPETTKAFDEYIRLKEARLHDEVARGDFLWTDRAPDRKQQLRAGKIVTWAPDDKPDTDVPEGVIHDWLGAAFIHDTTVDRVISVVQDYERHSQVYQPEVIGSKILFHQGDDFKVFLRLKKKKVVTIVLNTEHDVHYSRLDDKRWVTRSYSTHIAEVENPGKPGEHELPVGKDHGFLWRLDSYWRFLERDGGVYIECEAVSLSRPVPAALRWLIDPIVRNLPRESLLNTLQATRNFMLHK